MVASASWSSGDPSRLVKAMVNAPAARAYLAAATVSGVLPECEPEDDDRALAEALGRAGQEFGGAEGEAGDLLGFAFDGVLTGHEQRVGAAASHE